MAVRGTMAALIAKLRLMVADPIVTSGQGATFSDQQIQDQLDLSRLDVRYDALKPVPTYASTGVSYNDYYDELRGGNWEADETLITGGFVTLSPLTSDEITGHWTFNNQLPPVYLAGKTFDIYRAAADLIEIKLASLAATTFDFTADGRTIGLAQIVRTLSAMRDGYRQQQRATPVQMRRDDFADSDDEARNARGGPVSGGVPFLTGP